ncbi:aa3-type cytochrome oxidase subunit IV, partial [Dietzia sp.]|uniref:aa3-type cytochrome oxidase subunit IV n=1 Tax=Dietzia sp. TaxID=1871616 RepID=UPI002FD9CB80
MHNAMRIFDGLAIFVGFISVAYIWLTHDSRTGIDWAGGTALVLSTLMLVFVAGYLHFVNARVNTLPEDVETAEVSDGAGELGFFSPGSIWPFLMAAVI